MWLHARFFFPVGLEFAARKQSQEAMTEHGSCAGSDGAEETDSKKGKWTQVATAFVSDLKMLAKLLCYGRKR